jgi:hypothetical protein
MNLTSMKCKPNPGIEPDPNDPNFYCKACDFKYLSNGRYRYHLRRTHKIALPSLLSKTNSSIQPDPNDPNFYCKSCDCKYKNNRRYREHLRRTHKMKFTTATEIQAKHLIQTMPNFNLNLAKLSI